MIELVVFDIAGTLIADHDEVTSAFEAALSEHGIRVSQEELREWKGGSKREVIRRFVRDEALVENVSADFRRILERGYLESLQPVPGAVGAVRTLRKMGIKTATNTGFYRELRDSMLERLGWRELFDAHVSSDDIARGRPAPDMILRAMEMTGVAHAANVMAVGDTPLDLLAAKNAGAIGVGVLTGVNPRSRLEREPHAHICASVVDVPPLCASGRAGIGH